MKLHIVAMLLLMPAATFLTGCSTYAYEDDRPVGTYGYYDGGVYYSRVPRYYGYRNYRGYRGDYHGDYRGRPGEFDHGHPGNFDHGHPAPPHREEFHAPVGGNDHHAFVAPEGGARGDGGHDGGDHR